MHRPFLPNNEEAIFDELGPTLPLLLRECVDHGFFLHQQSLIADPDAAAVYDVSTRKSMCNARCRAVCRRLIPDLQDRKAGMEPTENKCSDELWVGRYLAVRFKDITKPGHRSSNYPTKRQKDIRSSVGAVVQQLSLQFEGLPVDDVPRLFLTVGFVTDVLGERILEVRLGHEVKDSWLWHTYLPEVGEVDALPAPMAQAITQMQELRSA